MPSETETQGAEVNQGAQAVPSPVPTDLKRLEAGLDALETPRSEKRKFRSFLFTLLSPLIAIVAILLIWQIDRWDRVFFFGPGAKVDLFAALGAKRPEFILFRPFHFGATAWAVYDGCHTKFSSKTTQSQFKRDLALEWLRFHVAIL